VKLSEIKNRDLSTLTKLQMEYIIVAREYQIVIFCFIFICYFNTDIQN